MRMGLQVSADRGRYATKVEKLQADAALGRRGGPRHRLDAPDPRRVRRHDGGHAARRGDVADRGRHVGGAVQPRHPIVLAQQALSTQAVCGGRFTLGLGVSHHWIIEDMLGLPYERQATTMRCYLDVLDQALAGPGLVEVDNELFHIRNPLDVTDLTPTPVMIAALGPVMLQAGRRAGGGHRPVARRRAHHRWPRRPADHEGRGGGGPTCAAGDGRRARLPVRATTRSTLRSSGRTGR